MMGHLLSLSSLTPAITGAEHFDDGGGSDGAKAVCDGAHGKLLDGNVHFLNPKIAFLYSDADVGVLVEHLVDGDEQLIPIAVTERIQYISPMRYVGIERICTQSYRRTCQYDPEPFPRDDPTSLWRPWRYRYRY